MSKRMENKEKSEKRGRKSAKERNLDLDGTSATTRLHSRYFGYGEATQPVLGLRRMMVAGTRATMGLSCAVLGLR